MPKAYLKIASKVGAALRGKLRQVEREPLPEELVRLLQKLDEQRESAGDQPNPPQDALSTKTQQPPKFKSPT